MSRKVVISLPGRMLREVRLAEVAAIDAGNPQDTGTGFTIIRLNRHQPPLRSLLEAGKIGSLELQAAEEIELAVTAVSGRGILRASVLERFDKGQNDRDWPAHVALAVRNYQRWQKHWSREWQSTRNPMLEIIWDAVIDVRPISVISASVGFSRHIVRTAICVGLRHYAVRAGFVSGNQARAWLDAAQGLVFKTTIGPQKLT